MRRTPPLPLLLPHELARHGSPTHAAGTFKKGPADVWREGRGGLLKGGPMGAPAASVAVCATEGSEVARVNGGLLDGGTTARISPAHAAGTLTKGPADGRREGDTGHRGRGES